MPVDIGNADL